MAIWSKGGDDTNALVHAFTVGDDYLFDRELAPYDCLGSIAHARMLGETGIIPGRDAEALEQGLRQLHSSFQARDWTVEATDEDVHSKIELLLTERLGEPAKRLHTGRSRNDQVLTDVRLWIKDRLADLALRTVAVAEAMLAQAREHEFCPLPGYTHLQRGMPSSVGMFFAGHARALLDDLILLEAAWRFADSCPLGSGASYGVGLPLDRERTARLLGFERFGAPAMADANSRGKVETAVLDAASAILGDCSRLAADLVFFTTAECGYFSLGSGFTTGSSIMPQKKNPDIFELLRGRAARFLGLRTGLAATTIGLHSGYSRDLQDTKALLIDGVRLLDQSLALLQEAIPTLEPRRDRIEAALTPELYATDEAYRLVREEGIAFRDAYVQVGQDLASLQTPDHEAVLRSRTHLGSTGNLGLTGIAAEAAALDSTWERHRDELHSCWQDLLSGPERADGG